MNIEDFNKLFFQFLEESPTPFHAVQYGATFLEEHGFSRLKESELWNLSSYGSYYVVREQGALIAFTLGKNETKADGFRILSAHTDSPGLQVKPIPDVQSGMFGQLGVEIYGGNLLGPWFDRDLSLAGRVCCQTSGGKLVTLLVDFKRPVLFIPSVAIHFDRDANKNRTINAQKDIPPVISLVAAEQLSDFPEILENQCRKEYPNSRIEKVLGFDMFCYDTAKPVLTGLNQEFISGGRLDNLVSCFAGLTGITQSGFKQNTLLYCANHEENGSNSSTGAQGSFLDSVFDRLYHSVEEKRRGLSQSFFISMDNAHASHPNCNEKMEPQHVIHLNKGPVIKYNANQRYTTYSATSAVFKKICDDASVPYQEFVMRSDLPCGSTIGPITASRLGLLSLDIGVPSLAMHSIREHTGSSDPYDLYRAASAFCQSDVHRDIIDF